MTPDELEDEILLAELKRRLDRDNGIRHSLEDVLTDLGLDQPQGAMDCRRNRVAVAVSNWALNRIATPAYRVQVDALVRLGIWHSYGQGVDPIDEWARIQHQQTPP